MIKKTLNLAYFCSVCALLLLASCDTSFMYKSDGSLEKLKQKTTIQTFDHLKEPIVIAMPVYDYLYLFGNKNGSFRMERLGDIIAVIDIESDTVYDWVFFPGNHGWSIWRLVEAGSNPTKYLMSSAGTGTVASLNPRETALTLTYTGIYDNFWLYKTCGTKIPQCYVSDYSTGSPWGYHTQLFDSRTNTLSQTDLCVWSSDISSIGFMRADADGNIWISYLKDNKIYIQQFDAETETVRPALGTFDTREEKDMYHIVCASEKYIFVSAQIRRDIRESRLYVMDRTTGEKTEITALTADWDTRYVCDVLEVNGAFYAVQACLGVGESGENLYRIDADTLAVENEYYHLPFDMTDNVYVRGDRMYFMRSRNPSDITYTYYDTVTKKQGPVIRVSAEQIIADYFGE